MANTTGKKFGGRKKGTPNKTTHEIRQLFLELIQKNLSQIEEDLSNLEPYERIKLTIELSKLVVPKTRAIEDVTNTDLEPRTFVIVPASQKTA